MNMKNPNIENNDEDEMIARWARRKSLHAYANEKSRYVYPICVKQEKSKQCNENAMESSQEQISRK